jgi:hypothetical protein
MQVISLQKVIITALFIIGFFIVSPLKISYSKSSVAQNTFLTLTGQSEKSDVAANFLGFKLLLDHENPYPILGPGLKKIGIDWDVQHASTHPPTTLLLVAPLSFSTWPIFSLLWAWLMTLLLYLSFPKEIKGSPKKILLLLALLFWPPISFSLGQLTIIWLWCIVMAYRFREQRPIIAGIFIGIATFTKFLPIVMLCPFVIRKKWGAVIGFALIWALAVTLLYVLDPQIWSSYFKANSSNFTNQMMRDDGSSFLVFLYKKFDIFGALITIILMLGFLLSFLNFYLKQGISRVISEFEWQGYLFLSIIMLPIAWIYSVVPLIPILWSLLRSTKVTLNILGFIALFSVVIFPPFGLNSIYGVFIFFMGIYISFFIQKKYYFENKSKF